MHRHICVWMNIKITHMYISVCMNVCMHTSMYICVCIYATSRYTFRYVYGKTYMSLYIGRHVYILDICKQTCMAHMCVCSYG